MRQTLELAQLRAAPWQVPALQVSFTVQYRPSLHDAVLFVWTQPVAGLQESSVQPLPSLQFGATPPTHDPPAHVSLVVQALPSSQDTVLFAWTQPVAGLQESSVQTLPSFQFGATPPTHLPPAHVSFVVHASPSWYADLLFVWTQPVAGLHESSVHPLPSSQFGATPPTHDPPEQVSLVVQALPSLHDDVLLV